ncbi:hypothetical protein BG003_001767, partial [Podila horticola]
LTRQPYLAPFVNEMMMGLKGSTVLHSDIVTLKLKCTLLKPSQVTWKINAANGSIAINIAASLYNTSDPAELNMDGDRVKNAWNSTVLKSSHEGLPAYIMSYNVFGTVASADNNTNYTFASDATYLKAYVYACHIDINQYNISGKITSNPGPSLDRLQLTSKIPSPGDFEESGNMYTAVVRALTSFGETVLQQQWGAIEICRPIQC